MFNNLNKIVGINYRGQLLPNSRQASSNASEGGGINRESSLDDSGVVDDHDDGQDITNTELADASTVEVNLLLSFLFQFYKKNIFFIFFKLQRDITPVTIALTQREVRIIKCNGNIAKLKRNSIYSLHPEYLSQIVMIGIRISNKKKKKFSFY